MVGVTLNFIEADAQEYDPHHSKIRDKQEGVSIAENKRHYQDQAQHTPDHNEMVRPLTPF